MKKIDNKWMLLVEYFSLIMTQYQKLLLIQFWARGNHYSELTA